MWKLLLGTNSAYSLGCVQPGIAYCQDKLGNDTQKPTAAFNAARSSNVNEMKPSAGDVDDLQTFPFLEGDTDGLNVESPTLAADAGTGVDSLEWWKSHRESVSFLRVFSILNQSFGDQQQNSLEDMWGPQLCHNSTSNNYIVLYSSSIIFGGIIIRMMGQNQE